MPVACHLYLCRTNNYGVLVRDEGSGQVALIDVPEEGPTREAIAQTGWEPTHIFLTHHHYDHTDDVAPIRDSYDVKVVGNAADAHRLPKLDITVEPGGTVDLGETSFRIIDTPGHTIGHIAYVSDAEKLAFVGDTLFAIGCGRMFEGTPELFFNTLQTLSKLDPATKIYCGHEYTEANIDFALSQDPDNAGLKKHLADIQALGARGEPTAPTTMATELALNPLMRARSADEFGKLRLAKDNF